MPWLRGLVIAAAVAALAIGTFGASAAAAPVGHMAFVNGIPGKAIDVCINGQEVRSSLRYGGKVAKNPPAGQTTLKVAIAAAGKCKGNILLNASGLLVAGTDITYVATAKAPKIVIFNNSGLGTIDTSLTDQSALALRHAADLGEVLWIIQLATPIAPLAVPPKWERGDFFGG